jgi:hypothetical protein
MLFLYQTIALAMDSGIHSQREKLGLFCWITVGSSHPAITQARHHGERGDVPERQRMLLKGETARRRRGLPFLGEVT